MVDALTNAGVANACVMAFPNDFGAATRVTTAPDGSYSFSEVAGTPGNPGTFGGNWSLTPGTYILSVDPTCAQNNVSLFAPRRCRVWP